MAPRHAARRGPPESPYGTLEGNADGVQWPNGRSPGGGLARTQAPPGAARNSVRLTFCLMVELANASGQCGQPILPQLAHPLREKQSIS
jgi:hypothetical protein